MTKGVGVGGRVIGYLGRMSESGTTRPPDAKRVTLSKSDQYGVLAATFFSFAPVGSFLAMMVQPPWGWAGALYGAVVAGGSSLMWSAAFMYRQFWAIPLIVLWQIFGPWKIAKLLRPSGILQAGAEVDEGWRLVINGAMGIAFMIVGYILSIRATSRVERRGAAARAELGVARQMHESLVPAIDARIGPLRIYGKSSPSTEMGGDLVDCFTRGTRTHVFLADVAGHGVRAGVLMAMLKSSLRTLLLEDLPLDRVVRDANRAILQVNEPGMFITFAAMRFEHRGEAVFTLAGHLPILRFDAASGNVVDLPNEELPLGIDDSPQYATRTTPANPGDLFVLLTDGLMEVMDPRGKQMGLERLRKLVARCARSPEPEVFERIMEAVRAHGPQADDQSMLLVRVS